MTDVGSHTKEKLTGKVFVITKAERPLRAAERALQLADWVVHPHSHLHGFLKNLAGTRTDVPLRLLELSAGSIVSGSVVHRLEDHVTKKSTLNNFRPNITTHVYLSTDEMGKYSRGRETYILHYQGVIHFGYAILQLAAAGLEAVPQTELHLHMLCKRCSEVIPDTKLHTEVLPPNMYINKQNPLLFSSVQQSKLEFDVSSGVLVTLVPSGSDQDAAGYIIAVKVLQDIHLLDYGVTEKSAVEESSLGAQEILRIGIGRLITSLTAFLSYLNPFDEARFRSTIMIMGRRGWGGLMDLCLLPTVLPDLIKLAGGYQSDPYVNRLHTAGLITQAILRCYQRFNKNSSWPLVTLFLSSYVGIAKTLKMWAQMLCLRTRTQVQTSIIPLSREGAIPARQLIDLFTRYMLDAGRLDLLCDVIIKNKLKISRSPPEIALRSQPHPLTMTQPIKPFTGLLSVHKGIEVTDNMPTWIELSLPSHQVETFSPSYPVLIAPAPTLIYNIDRMFHLFGHTSSSFFKTLDILSQLDTSKVARAAVLGDGEGGISRLLYSLTGKAVIFNSLISTKDLIPHRGTSYVPASFADCQEGVIGGPISALSGGDLRDINTLYLLSAEYNDNIQLVWNDSEIGYENPLDLMRMYRNILWYCHKHKTEIVISKNYLVHPIVNADIVGMYQVLYKKVSVNVSIFSSNERFEAYIVGTQLRNDDLITSDRWLTDWHRVSSAPALIPVLSRTQSKRITGQLHQVVYMNGAKQLFEMAKDLSMPSLIPRAFEKLTNWYIPMDSSISLLTLYHTQHCFL